MDALSFSRSFVWHSRTMSDCHPAASSVDAGGIAGDVAGKFRLPIVEPRFRHAPVETGRIGMLVPLSGLLPIGFVVVGDEGQARGVDIAIGF